MPTAPQNASSTLETAREIGQGVKQNLSQAATVLDRWWDMAVEFFPRLLGALVILFIAWMVSSWARRAIYKALNRPHFDQTLVRFFSTASKWIIMVVAFVAILGVLGIPTTSVLAVMGAAGLAIGLALQGSLSNLAAGIMLLIMRPFKVGDVVNISGQLGKIDEIALFHTYLDTLDNRRMLMPNGAVFANQIENLTHHPRRRIDITVGVEYGADVERTRAALERGIASIDSLLKEPAPEVVLTGLGTSSVDWQVRVWTPTQDFGLNRQKVIRACKVALEEAGISIPFPQTDVWMRQWTPPKALGPDDRSRLKLIDAVPTPAEPDPE